jgi:hypothetical protein
MYFDRFDILSAYYLFGINYHSGQFSKAYAYMGRAMRAGYKPGTNETARGLNENALAIYKSLLERRLGPDAWYYESSSLACFDGCTCCV